MENIDFKLAGQPWEKEEDDQLIKGYNIDMLTVLELCKIHKRMPGGIISRLRRLDLIDMRHKARGYDEYEKSDLYKEICKSKQENKVKRLEKNEEKLLGASIDTKKQTFISSTFAVDKGNKPLFISNDSANIVLPPEYIQDNTDRQNARIQRKKMPSDISQLKSDVSEIKEKVNKILELFNALYEFETQ